jgi:uncharacterized membrane protein
VRLPAGGHRDDESRAVRSVTGGGVVMTAFTVWRFETPEGAQHAESMLEGAQRDGIVKILDHAVVTWPSGAPHPTTKHGREESWRGTGWGAFWGLLVGALVTLPVLGLAAGAGLGALAKATERLGITEEQLKSIGREITEGSSALFLVTEAGDLDRLGERLIGVKMKLVETNLTETEQAMLKEAFGSS